MKAFILHFVLLGLAGLGLCFPGSPYAEVPSFSWDANETSTDGIPYLVVSFGDGKPDDVLVLWYNDNLGESTDSEGCYFQGRLMNEPGVYAALNGCPMDDTFELVMNSKRHFAHSFKSVNGYVQAELVGEGAAPEKRCLTEDAVDERQLPFDVSLGDLYDFGNYSNMSSEYASELPAYMNLTMSVSYDNTWVEKFGSNAVGKVKEIINKGQAIMRWDSLGAATDITFDVKELKHIPIDLSVTGDNLAKMANEKSQTNPLDVNSYVYLCVVKEGGFAGLAYVGTVCSSKALRSSLSGWSSSDTYTAETFVHELGHNLNMKHDFKDKPGNARLDKEGQTCTNIHAIMDYFQAYYDKWSSCSLEDLQDLYKQVMDTTGSWCIN